MSICHEVILDYKMAYRYLQYKNGIYVLMRWIFKSAYAYDIFWSSTHVHIKINVK